MAKQPLAADEQSIIEAKSVPFRDVFLTAPFLGWPEGKVLRLDTGTLSQFENDGMKCRDATDEEVRIAAIT
jgi:hypothetical protein